MVRIQKGALRRQELLLGRPRQPGALIVYKEDIAMKISAGMEQVEQTFRTCSGNCQPSRPGAPGHKLVGINGGRQRLRQYRQFHRAGERNRNDQAMMQLLGGDYAIALQDSACTVAQDELT